MKKMLLLFCIIILSFTSFSATTVSPLFEFQVLSDTHISNKIPQNSYNLKQAFVDIKNNSKNSSAIILDGDVVDSCSQDSYNLLNSLIESEKNNLPPIYYAIGNHEFFYSNSYTESINCFLKNTNTPNVYYDKWINDYHFIFLGSEKYPENNFADLSTNQLSWLENTLSINSSNNKPIFVFFHQPLKDTVAGSINNQGWNGIIQNDALKNLLSEYPQAIVFTGHSHWQLGSNNTYYKDFCNYINTSSVSYLSTDNSAYVPGSEGLYVEVYNNKVLIKGRNFSQNKWIDNSIFTICY